MKTIYKYPLQITDYQQIEMPVESRIISVINQDNRLVLYAEVDPNNITDLYDIYVVGTGNPIKEIDLNIMKFINTVSMPPYVWHVYC